ncbi:MAG: hypothetical protein KDA61_00715, partial [Planctomycetales bacterium]|nr:hypothetical protein [Planctomycetales bacterium]
MASPFRHFRKHQRTFMAVAAVLCMVIFVLGSALSGNGRGNDGRRAAGAKVASWNGGSITEGEMGRLVVERNLVNEFLRRLYSEGLRAVGMQQNPTVPAFVYDPSQASHEAVETLVLRTEVFSDLATKAGMSVSDDVINYYLQEWSLRKLPTDHVLAVLRSVGQGNLQANEAILYSTLRKLLLEHFYSNVSNDASLVTTPQEQWQEWRRLNERISLQVAVLPADDFVEQAPNPTDEELAKFFDEYKTLEPNRFDFASGRELPIADPGFARPRRVELKYGAGKLN